MYKDIVVPITGTPGDKYALTTALTPAAAPAAPLSVQDPITMPLPISQ